MARVALVTGTSSGFGLLTAISLARAGLRVLASMRTLTRRADLERAAADAGVSLEVVELDVNKPESIADTIARAGPIDVLVNNAGTSILGSVENMAMHELREIFETNFFGATAMMKAVLPDMRARRSGRIINVASVAGKIALGGISAYSASKHALEGLSDALRFEVQQLGIQVSLIEPGMFPTMMTRTPRLTERHGGPYEDVERAFAGMLEEACERAPDLQQVADAIVHAATARSPRHRYVVGSDASAILALHSLLPARAFEALVRRKLKPRPRQRTA